MLDADAEDVQTISFPKAKPTPRKRAIGNGGQVNQGDEPATTPTPKKRNRKSAATQKAVDEQTSSIAENTSH